MLEDITRSIINIINSTYLFFSETLGSLSFLDSPGTYILWIVVGLIYVPFFVKNVYSQYANPHGYYAISIVRKVIMGAIFISAWMIFGYANFIRFLQ